MESVYFMKLTVDTKLENNNYTATFDVTDITEAELELISDFGDIEINVGGAIQDSLGADLITLGNSYKKFPSDLPFARAFNQAQYGDDAEAIATAYVQNITDKIEAGITLLKAKTDTFSGTTEIIL